MIWMEMLRYGPLKRKKKKSILEMMTSAAKQIIAIEM
jgi:hypothetical protein